MGVFASKPEQPIAVISASKPRDEEPSWAIAAFSKQDDWCDCPSWANTGTYYRDSYSCSSTCSQYGGPHWHCVDCGKNTGSNL